MQALVRCRNVVQERCARRMRLCVDVAYDYAMQLCCASEDNSLALIASRPHESKRTISRRRVEVFIMSMRELSIPCTLDLSLSRAFRKCMGHPHNAMVKLQCACTARKFGLFAFLVNGA